MGRKKKGYREVHLHVLVIQYDTTCMYVVQKFLLHYTTTTSTNGDVSACVQLYSYCLFFFQCV